MDAAEVERDVAGATGSHVGLVTMIGGLLTDGALDGSAPSRLPGWTVGHVLTHLARNADSITAALEASGRGDVVERYADGVAGRTAAIEKGARRPPGELVDDVRRSIRRLERTWSDHPAWDGRTIETHGQELPVWALPGLRWREVEVHRVDLGLGYEPEDWPAHYLRVDLRALEMQWRARRPMGLTGLPAAALAAPPPTRLAWLLGRAEVNGLEPAGMI